MQAKVFLVDYVIVYKQDGKYKHSYSFDANGNWLKYLSEIWENDEWVNSRRYTYTYDLTKLYERWENDDWVNYWRYTYIYDANGNLMTTLAEKWENDAWVNYWRDNKAI